jgi:hypothetical protein
MGPQALFGEEPRVNLLRPIEDADAVFPEKHKADLAVLSLPPTLEEAVRTFLLRARIPKV